MSIGDGEQLDFELDGDDDRARMVGSALDYANPNLLAQGDLSSEIFGVDPELVDDVFADRDIEMLGERLVAAAGLHENGAGIKSGFNVLDENQLKGWRKSGRIPKSVKTAEDFVEWRAKNSRRKASDVKLDDVLVRRLTTELQRAARPDYQKPVDGDEFVPAGGYADWKGE